MVKVTDLLNLLYICPACGSKNTGKIAVDLYFCRECCVQYGINTNQIYEIGFDGELVCVCENEFSNCG